MNELLLLGIKYILKNDKGVLILAKKCTLMIKRLLRTILQKKKNIFGVGFKRWRLRWRNLNIKHFVTYCTSLIVWEIILTQTKTAFQIAPLCNITNIHSDM